MTRMGGKKGVRPRKMTDINQIRRDNARALMEGMSKADFGRMIGRSSSQVGHIIGPNPTRNIGNPMARHIERCFNKPTGWMDIQHKKVQDASAEVIKQYPESGIVRIPMYNADLAAGIGAHIDMDAVTDFIELPRGVCEDHGLNPDAIVAAKVRGDSMMPRLMDGDIVLIDTGDKRPRDGQVYAIAVDDELRVKRILRPLGSSHLVITSDNKSDPAYRDETISLHNFEQLRVIGRVVSIWFSGI